MDQVTSYIITYVNINIKDKKMIYKIFKELIQNLKI
jgi:hypothetical protein